MNNKKFFTIIAAVIVLAVGGAALYYGLRGDTTAPNSSDMSGMNHSMNNSDSLVDTSSTTYKQYAALTGEEYDRNFIANMIVHHEGAVSMAELALANAKHQEFKDMANDIISAQNEEISQMEVMAGKAWAIHHQVGII